MKPQIQITRLVPANDYEKLDEKRGRLAADMTMHGNGFVVRAVAASG